MVKVSFGKFIVISRLTELIEEEVEEDQHGAHAEDKEHDEERRDVDRQLLVSAASPVLRLNTVSLLLPPLQAAQHLLLQPEVVLDVAGPEGPEDDGTDGHDENNDQGGVETLVVSTVVTVNVEMSLRVGLVELQYSLLGISLHQRHDLYGDVVVRAVVFIANNPVRDQTPGLVMLQSLGSLGNTAVTDVTAAIDVTEHVLHNIQPLIVFTTVDCPDINY